MDCPEIDDVDDLLLSCSLVLLGLVEDAALEVEEQLIFWYLLFVCDESGCLGYI